MLRPCSPPGVGRPARRALEDVVGSESAGPPPSCGGPSLSRLRGWRAAEDRSRHFNRWSRQKVCDAEFYELAKQYSDSQGQTRGDLVADTSFVKKTFMVGLWLENAPSTVAEKLPKIRPVRYSWRSSGCMLSRGS